MTQEVRSPVDADRAARYVAELAVPRLSGTDMEHKTASRIEQHFRSTWTCPGSVDTLDRTKVLGVCHGKAEASIVHEGVQG